MAHTKKIKAKKSSPPSVSRLFKCREVNGMTMNKANGSNYFLVCENTETKCSVPNHIRSIEGPNDLNALRQGGLEKNSSAERYDKMPRAIETIPLVILQETCHYCAPTVDTCLIEGIPQLKKRATGGGCSAGEEGDMCTLCTLSSSLSSIEFDSRLFKCWSDKGGLDVDDDDENMDDLYFAKESKSSSLDYSSSRFDDEITVDESFQSRLESRDENYFTEGFIEVGDLPRVS